MTQLTNQKIAFIGSGMMAEAIISGLLKQDLLPAENITAADINADRRQDLHHRYGLTTAADNATAVQTADIVVLSVKPQYFADAAADLPGRLQSHALVLSIMAGTTIAEIKQRLEHEAIVRAMPNTPAQIGRGISAWTATAAVTTAQEAQATAVLSAFGETVQVPKEPYIDMATAINGSGPGYVFLILEGMVDAAVQLGFGRDVAEKLVLQTVIGSAHYAQESDLHLAELRNRVTSAGGTTAAGLYALEKGGLRATLADGIRAAYARSQELGRN